MLNLALHCGAHPVSFDELIDTHTPEPTESHVPVPHRELFGYVAGELHRAGGRIMQTAHGLARDGSNYFGMIEVDGAGTDDHSIVIGVRNSHVKDFSASVAMGSGVFVCDNLAFSGEVVLARKHTRHIMRDLPALIPRAISRLSDLRKHQDQQIAAYKEYPMEDTNEVAELILRASDTRVIPGASIQKVWQQWNKPIHPEWEPRNLWSLFNCFTETNKGLAAATQMERTGRLHGLADIQCGLALAT